MKEKITQLVEGIVLLVLGILIAVFGASEVLDVYYGVVALIGGVALVALSIVNLATHKPLVFGQLFLGVALLTIGSSLLSGLLSVMGTIITLIVLLIIALGVALVAYGVYTIIKFNLFNGVGKIVIGAACVVLGSLYLAIADFQVVFWIIVGVLIALYGVLVGVTAFVGNKKKEA